MSRSIPVALTIAGSDSGGGAGIQADLKTFQELGVFGASAITALTAQNSLGVQRIKTVSASMVASQVESVLADIGADVVKTGMLPTAAIVEKVARAVRKHNVARLVVDPVLVAKDDAALASDQALQAACRDLFPLAAVVTPNIPEASHLLGVAPEAIRTENEMEQAARELHRMFGCGHVLLKGGHRGGNESADVLVGDTDGPLWLRALRVPTRHTHGTGCTTASAIAAGLARGLSVSGACRLAKAFVTAAIHAAVPLGAGIGSLRHAVWRNRA